MTPEEKSLLERTYKIVEENNTILRSIRRSNRVSTVIKLLYWIVIIGLSFGAFYLIQPYVETMTSLYDQVKGDAATIHSSTNSIKDLFK